MSPIPFTARLQPSADVLLQELDGEAVLLNLQSGKYFGLNAVGLRMWQLLVSNSSVEAAYGQLAGEFDVDAQVLRDDLGRLMSELLEHKLLTIA
jgi:hypothetical protein